MHGFTVEDFAKAIADEDDDPQQLADKAHLTGLLLMLHQKHNVPFDKSPL
eukprot:m.160163 g.160163  ORF g.160163 m.160163 type:complete len:50 (+) comp9847_c0_seq7:339-488(+)